jgi:hypothetical protein
LQAPQYTERERRFLRFAIPEINRFVSSRDRARKMITDGRDDLTAAALTGSLPKTGAVLQAQLTAQVPCG